MLNIKRRNLIQTAAIGSAMATFVGAGTAQAASKDLYVIAEIIAKPGSADELRTLLVPFARGARKEPGCRQYTLMEVEAEAGRFLTFERWSGHAALDAHMKTPQLAALGPKLETLLAKPFTQIFLADVKSN